MARDIREPKAGLDRNKYYKGELTNNNKLTRADECEGVFYSYDYEPINITNDSQNGVNHTRKTVKLGTNDYIPTLMPNDFVLYNDEYWIVDTVQAADQDDNAKLFKRHSTKYIIGLSI